MMFACYAILEIGFLLPHTSHCYTAHVFTVSM